MFHMYHFLFSHIPSRVPIISTSDEFTYNKWVQGSKIVHFKKNLCYYIYILLLFKKFNIQFFLLNV